MPHILHRYGEGVEGEEGSLSVEQLLSFLSKPCDSELGMAARVIQGLEESGESQHPTHSQLALLTWIDSAFSHWQDHYPTEEPLAAELRRLLPLCAALAITDPGFLTPGAHPVHRAIDALQGRAVGWQKQLGRAGDQFLSQIRQFVEKAEHWLQRDDDEESRIDLKQLAAEMIATCIRDQNRFARMMKRVVETKRGRLRTTGARMLAAHTLNSLAEEYKAPTPIAEFLLGPWYDSIQLVLLKHGQKSVEWQTVEQLTRDLLESIQPLAADHLDAQKQALLDKASRIPGELREWLLSLHHDEEQVTETLQLIEFTYLRIMRGQPLVLEPIDHLETDVETAGDSQTDADEAGIGDLHTGQWFAITPEEGETVRAELALNLINERQLLFVNQAGIKALEKSYAQFAQLIAEERVQALPIGASFSKSLAWAVDIVNEEDLACLGDPAALAALHQMRRDAEEAARREAEAEVEAELEVLSSTPPDDSEIEVLPSAEDTAPELEVVSAGNTDSGDANQPEVLELEPTTIEPVAGESELEFELEDVELSPPAAPVENTPAAPAPEKPKATETAKAHSLLIPMGTWLGFHDGEMPMMAKLAVHDRQNENFIFVDREGIRLRDITRGELLALIEEDKVEILESRVSFKDRLAQAREEDL